ncbi:MAG TPA: Imm21 family immunity protein [Xanthobacteraceae bacterium]|jgi:hypothetical protein|nr:Imm21 family immunity protein [Xanthobacteraceae bacterium]
MKFIDSNGGPLVMLERDLLPLWKGDDGASVRQAVGLISEVQTDYQRACAIPGWIGKIEVDDDRYGIVFWGDLLGLGYVKNNDGSVLIVRPYCDIEDIYNHIMIANNNARALRKDFDIRIECRKSVIFDSAFPGEEILSDCLHLDLSPGRYEALTYSHKIEDAEIVFHLLRLRPDT